MRDEPAQILDRAVSSPRIPNALKSLAGGVIYGLYQQVLPEKRSTRNVSPLRHANFTIRNLTRAAPRIIECSTMSVITVKRVIKRTPKQTSRIRRPFGELARHYFAHESRWQFAIEALLFAILLAISAWPIFAAAEAVCELLQRTSS